MNPGKTPNLTNGATNFTWQADVRSGTNILFVAGDKDGLGSGGSTDVMSIGSGDSSCVNNQSPSSTAGPAAGGRLQVESPDRHGPVREGLRHGLETNHPTSQPHGPDSSEAARVTK